ncbi:HAD hydrolase-like protein, partial [Staphylococcus hominis]
LLHNKKKNIFVISSNETAVVTRQLDYLGLNRFIKDALGLHIKELRKPHYKILQSIIQNNHLNQGRTVYIGDTTHDVKIESLSDIRSCVVNCGALS